MRSWHKYYHYGGLDELTLFDWQGGHSKLTALQEEQLTAHLGAHIYADTKPIRGYLWAEFQVRYSHSGCIKLLHRLGFVYRKPTALPAQVDEATQQVFINEYNILRTLGNPNVLSIFSFIIHQLIRKPVPSFRVDGV